MGAVSEDAVQHPSGKNKKGPHPNTPPLWETSRAQHCQAGRYSWAMKNMNISEDGLFSRPITQQIEQHNLDAKVSQVGTVVQVEDGIALIYGLDQVIVGDLIGFEDGGTVGIAQDLKENIVRVALTGEGLNIQEGSQVILERNRPRMFIPSEE